MSRQAEKSAGSSLFLVSYVLAPPSTVSGTIRYHDADKRDIGQERNVVYCVLSGVSIFR